MLALAGSLSWWLIPEEVNAGRVTKRRGITFRNLTEDKHMDVEVNDLNPLDSDEEEEEGEEVSFDMITGNQRLMMSVLSCILATIFLLYTEPIISDHLIEIGVSDDYIGYIFASACFAYAVAAPVVGCLTSKFSKESLTLFAFTLSSLALLIQGPSRLFGLDQ
jgi:hypothetical protein